MKTLKIIFSDLEYVVLCKYEWYELSNTSDRLASGNAQQVQFQNILHQRNVRIHSVWTSKPNIDILGNKTSAHCTVVVPGWVVKWSEFKP